VIANDNRGPLGWERNPNTIPRLMNWGGRHKGRRDSKVIPAGAREGCHLGREDYGNFGSAPPEIKAVEVSSLCLGEKSSRTAICSATKGDTHKGGKGGSKKKRRSREGEKKEKTFDAGKGSRSAYVRWRNTGWPRGTRGERK